MISARKTGYPMKSNRQDMKSTNNLDLQDPIFEHFDLD